MGINHPQMRILFFGKTPPPYTGMTLISKTILDILESSDNYYVDIINSSTGRLRSNTPLGLIKYYLFQIPTIIKTTINLFHKIREHNYSALYFVASSSFTGNVVDVIVSYIAKKNNLTVIAHLHNGNFNNTFEQPRLFNGGKKILSNIDTFIFGTEGLYQPCTKFIERNKIKIIPNPIDRDLYCTDEEVQSKWKEHSNNDQIRILYLANFIESKGFLLLKNAVENIYQIGLEDKIKVCFAGSWSNDYKEQEFIESINKSKASHCFHYIGPIKSRTKVKEELISADILCLPSYYPFEAQPVSIIEAMNAGNAILSTYHASIPEIVINGKDGILVEKGNEQALTRGLQQMMVRSHVTSMGQSSRANFMRRFHNDIIKQQLYETFRP